MKAISIDKSACVRDSEQQGNLDYDPKLHLYQMNVKDMATSLGSPQIANGKKTNLSVSRRRTIS
jgi:hypothetical protein